MSCPPCRMPVLCDFWDHEMRVVDGRKVKCVHVLNERAMRTSGEPDWEVI
jgi:hypothetical protein